MPEAEKGFFMRNSFMVWNLN